MGTLFPRIINKSPLLTSTAELRFSTAMPGAALFGLFFAAERGRYPTVEQLPMASFPDEIRKTNPQLTFQAHYKLKSAGNGPTIQIGPRTFGVFCEPNTTHIDVAFIESELGRLLGVLDGLGFITSYDRLGMRYVNFFEGQNVLKRSTISMSIEEMDLTGFQTQYRVEIPQEPFKAALSVMSDAQVSMGAQLLLTAPSDAKRGSLIDIDVFADPLKLAQGSKPEQMTEMFKSAHDVAKRLFFKTLTDEFIRELDPED